MPAPGSDSVAPCSATCVFVDRTARFVTSFSQRGLIAEHGVSWMLPRLIGPANALDILWTGRRFEGEEAARLGLANRVCEPGECVNDAKAYLREINKTASPKSIMMMKKQIYRHLNADLGAAMKESTVWMDESPGARGLQGGRSELRQASPAELLTDQGGLSLDAETT